jgi:hypothetical protein
MHFSTLLPTKSKNAKMTSAELHVLLSRELKSALKSKVGFLNTYFELFQFIDTIYITNKCNQYVICLSFIPFVRRFMHSNICISTSTENWTHVNMNLFTWNSPYYHLLRYILFLLKHSVCNHLCSSQWTVGYFPTGLCCNCLTND